MKNKIFLFILIVASCVGFSSCEDTTAGFTRITYYPSLELNGDAVVYLDKGDAYNDEGCVAILNGEDVSDQIETTNPVDTSVGGEYTVSYKVTNEDGFSAAASRTVYVIDTTPSVIENKFYIVQPGTQRFWIESEAVVPFDGYPIYIYQLEPGVFSISDFIGGYYDQRVGYGSAYAMTGTFQLNDDNTLTYIDSFLAGWGDSLDSFTDGVVDATTGQISYKCEYAGLMEFTIFLN